MRFRWLPITGSVTITADNRRVDLQPGPDTPHRGVKAREGTSPVIRLIRSLTAVCRLRGARAVVFPPADVRGSFLGLAGRRHPATTSATAA